MTTVPIDKRFGVKLAVTPNFLPNGMVKIKVDAQRTFLNANTDSAGSAYRLEISETTANANVVMRLAEAHGYTSSKDPYDANVTLAANEHIVRVNYRSGLRIDGVSFVSNLGKTYGPYGGGGGTALTYNVTPGEKLGCRAGRSGSSIDQLVFSSTGLL